MFCKLILSSFSSVNSVMHSSIIPPIISNKFSSDLQHSNISIADFFQFLILLLRFYSLKFRSFSSDSDLRITLYDDLLVSSILLPFQSYFFLSWMQSFEYEASNVVKGESKIAKENRQMTNYPQVVLLSSQGTRTKKEKLTESRIINFQDNHFCHHQHVHHTKCIRRVKTLRSLGRSSAYVAWQTKPIWTLISPFSMRIQRKSCR